MRFHLRTLLIALAIGPPMLLLSVTLCENILQYRPTPSKQPSPYDFLVISGGGSIEPATNLQQRSEIKEAHERNKSKDFSQ
jgi:hypothetical protein